MGYKTQFNAISHLALSYLSQLQVYQVHPQARTLKSTLELEPLTDHGQPWNNIVLIRKIE